MADSITLRQTDVHDANYKEIYNLRDEVLRKPIGLSLKDEDLSGDVRDVIFVAEKDNKIIGCVMMHPADSVQMLKLRQMAVYDSWQGKGIGKLLVTKAEEYCRQHHVNRIVLHARVTAEPFYEKLGYIKTSGVFTEVGIPHVKMEKEIV